MYLRAKLGFVAFGDEYPLNGLHAVTVALLCHVFKCHLCLCAARSGFSTQCQPALSTGMHETACRRTVNSAVDMLDKGWCLNKCTLTISCSGKPDAPWLSVLLCGYPCTSREMCDIVVLFSGAKLLSQFNMHASIQLFSPGYKPASLEAQHMEHASRPP